MKVTWKKLAVVALGLPLAVICLLFWIHERPRAKFARIVGFTPPPSVSNLRAEHSGGFQTWEDVLSFHIDPSDFPLLLRGRDFSQVPRSQNLDIAVEHLEQPPITNPVYFETTENVDDGHKWYIYTIRTNPEHTSIVFRRIGAQ